MRVEGPRAVEARTFAAAILAASVLSLPASVKVGQASGAQPEDPEIDQLVVEGERLPEGAADPFGVLDASPGDTVFGLDKTAWETPRSTASLSEELLGRHGIETVEDFSQIIPGAHTASFFGLAASIDLRGALADTHFRGMRRLVSAGGWQSLIRATDRVDIVRGPASPIHGAGSISGYINLVPKTARADEDRFIEAPRGDVAVRVASWDRYAFEGQRGGPARLFGKPAGYHVFGLWEDAGSYYREHPGQRQLMLQGTLVVDLRSDIWIEVGQQYQRWRGAENAGWNRIDQKLIDEGLYLSGEPLVDLDSDREGRISQREVLAVSPRNRLAVFQPYGQSGVTFDSEAERRALRLNPDTLRRVPIGSEHCLCAPSDSGAAESLAAYFDVFAELGGVTLRQKLFLDYADRHIVASYGFSQQHRTVLVEERLEAVFRGLELGRGLELDVRAAVSEHLGLLFSATRSRIYREPLTGRFIFAPPAITGLAPEDHYGGHVVTVLPAGDTRFRERGALPEFAITAGGTWQAARDLALTLGVSRVGPAWSGVARTVRLPAYTLANASVSWTIHRWTAILGVNNALDELYFQGNFPQIFGDVVVLARPERNWQLTLRRSFGS